MTQTIPKADKQPKETGSMRVEREFHRPDVVARLENIDEDVLAQLLTNASEQIKLTDEQIEGIRKAKKSLEAGHHVEDEQVTTWLNSWGTDNELPKPKCHCGCE
jgi:predicted transcriptional regulator